jgi:hypothetical protein
MAKQDSSGRGKGTDDPLSHDLGDDHGIDNPLTHDVGDDHGVDNSLTHDVGDDHGVDDPLTHDVGDDHGVDDPLTHDVGDDHGVDDPLTHDVGDDHGVDDPLTHDVGDDHGVDDPLTHDVGDDHGADDPLTHDVGDDHGVDDPLTHDVGDDHGLHVFVNRNSGQLVFTDDSAEREHWRGGRSHDDLNVELATAGSDEGVAVWRFHDSAADVYFWTADATLKDMLVTQLPQLDFDGEVFRAWGDDGGAARTAVGVVWDRNGGGEYGNFHYCDDASAVAIAGQSDADALVYLGVSFWL